MRGRKRTVRNGLLYTKSEINEIIDGVVHPWYETYPWMRFVDGLLHALNEQSPESVEKFIRYNLPDLLEEAEKWLKVFPAVKSGWVEPLEPSTLGWLEAGLCNILPYEFGLAFHRQTFLARGMHLQEYTGRLDIGHHFDGLAWPNPQMRVKTRLPTRAFQECLAYAPSLLLGSTPLAFAGGLIVWNLLK
jgi:hypothetical protein